MTLKRLIDYLKTEYLKLFPVWTMRCKYYRYVLPNGKVCYNRDGHSEPTRNAIKAWWQYHRLLEHPDCVRGSLYKDGREVRSFEKCKPIFK